MITLITPFVRDATSYPRLNRGCERFAFLPLPSGGWSKWCPMNTNHRFSLTKLIIFIFIIQCAYMPAADLDLREYFTNDIKISNQLNNIQGNIYSYDPTEAFRKIDAILDDYPNLLKAHLIKGHLYLHSKGDIEKAIREYQIVQERCDQIRNSGLHIISSYSEKMNKMLSQISTFAMPDIQEGFAPLRFKIKNKHIPKFCFLKNINIVFTWEDEVIHSASRFQETRLRFLENRLTSGKMRFQFSAYDSTDGKFYFEIPYFPLIEVRGGVDNPYAIILNNERRYHFNINHQSNEVVEIDWNDEWELVESVPSNQIKIEYYEPFSLTPRSKELELSIRYAFTTPESELGLKNLYIPIEENKYIEISLMPNKRDKILESSFYITTRVIIFVGILSTLILIR